MDRQANYNELIAAVFKNAYDELVVLIRKAKREEEKKITAPTTRSVLRNGPVIYQLHQPLYYYNYMREGSQTEVHNREA